MNPSEILKLHRDLVALPSMSHQEAAIADFLSAWLTDRGFAVERLGDNLLCELGADRGPSLCLNSHLDTVPPTPDWTRLPHEVSVEAGRVFGLGSNDAKASVAALVAAFVRLSRGAAQNLRVQLMLACEEETGGAGTAFVLSELRRQGRLPWAAVVGEPTGLDLAVAQKGLLQLELVTHGRACHAANARASGAPNALRLLARNMVRIDGVNLGRDHPLLGPVTLEPTVAAGGKARNAVPAEASALFDIRYPPGVDPEALAVRIGAVVEGGDLRVRSSRLGPCEIAVDHPVVRAALTARPEARVIGSSGMSDQAFFAREGIPALKVGPGQTSRSHTADEYVFEAEILEGSLFYERLVRALSEEMAAGR